MRAWPSEYSFVPMKYSVTPLRAPCAGIWSDAIWFAHTRNCSSAIPFATCPTTRRTASGERLVCPFPDARPVSSHSALPSTTTSRGISRVWRSR